MTIFFGLEGLGEHFVGFAFLLLLLFDRVLEGISPLSWLRCV